MFPTSGTLKDSTYNPGAQWSVLNSDGSYTAVTRDVNGNVVPVNNTPANQQAAAARGDLITVEDAVAAGTYESPVLNTGSYSTPHWPNQLEMSNALPSAEGALYDAFFSGDLTAYHSALDAYNNLRASAGLPNYTGELLQPDVVVLSKGTDSTGASTGTARLADQIAQGYAVPQAVQLAFPGVSLNDVLSHATDSSTATTAEPAMLDRGVLVPAPDASSGTNGRKVSAAVEQSKADAIQYQKTIMDPTQTLGVRSIARTQTAQQSTTVPPGAPVTETRGSGLGTAPPGSGAAVMQIRNNQNPPSQTAARQYPAGDTVAPQILALVSDQNAPQSADYWGYLYSQVTGKSAPAPEDLGFTGVARSTPIKFGVWYAALLAYEPASSTGAGGSVKTPPAAQPPASNAVVWAVLGAAAIVLLSRKEA